MDPKIMGVGGGLFVLLYLACIAVIVIYAFKLMGRFVSAQERVAGALETTARKLREDGKG